VGLSLLATIITSVTFIAYPGSAYAGDGSLLIPGFMFVVVLIVAGAVIIPLWESPSETALAEAEKLEALVRECG
jgi:Na+/proline symporter